MTLKEDFNYAAQELIGNQFATRIGALRDKEFHKCRKICLKRAKTDKLDPSFVKACAKYCISPTKFLFYLYFRDLGKEYENTNIIDYCDFFFKKEALFYSKHKHPEVAMFLESFVTY